MEMLENLKVKDIMTSEVITVPPEEDVVFAFEKLMKNKISALPVVKDEKLLGIVTATDLGHNLILDNYELGTTVEKVMVEDVICVKPEETIINAIKKMNDFGSEEGIVNQLVVLEDEVIVGILSDGDIIKNIKT